MPSLPPFSETLDQYGIRFKHVYKALNDYLDLAHEVMYSTDAQADPYGFLEQSDEYAALRAFFKIMERQWLEHFFADGEDDEQEGEEPF